MIKDFFYRMIGATPSPVKPREKPKPAPGPAPSPSPNPAPGRPSPRPGREPRPVTDPKNRIDPYLSLLPEEYFHTLKPDFRILLETAKPLPHPERLDLLESQVIRDRDETYSRWTGIENRHPEKKLAEIIKKKQNENHAPILHVIHSYLSEILGNNHHGIMENLDIQWKNPYDIDKKEERELDESQHIRRLEEVPDLTEEEIGYVSGTALRSEIYYQMIQGFGILYMDGFFRMMRNDLSQIDGDLPGLYEEFHLNGHNNHHRVFYDVMSGKRLPSNVDETMEKTKSEGRVWHSTEPVTDPDSGNVTGMRSHAHARSEIGVVLAHEALKGAFQLLTPYGRLHENYLNDVEMRLLRMALSSYWAEIRQFVLGPALFRMFQEYLDRLQIPSSASDETLYLALQNLLLLQDDRLHLHLSLIHNPSDFEIVSDIPFLAEELLQGLE